MDSQELRGIIDFLKQAEKLKNTLRCSHTSSGRQESAAEHSWRLCLLIVVLKRALAGLDMVKLLKLAVVHDLGEAVSGDIPAVAQDGSFCKAAEERKGMIAVCAPLPNETRMELLDLWDEYESALTPEAKILKALDKLETIIQHNQGENPPDFNYAFNLDYGQEYMDALPVLRRFRVMVDEETRHRALKRHACQEKEGQSR